MNHDCIMEATITAAAHCPSGCFGTRFTSSLCERSKRAWRAVHGWLRAQLVPCGWLRRSAVQGQDFKKTVLRLAVWARREDKLHKSENVGFSPRGAPKTSKHGLLGARLQVLRLVSLHKDIILLFSNVRPRRLVSQAISRESRSSWGKGFCETQPSSTAST